MCLENSTGHNFFNSTRYTSTGQTIVWRHARLLHSSHNMHSRPQRHNRPEKRLQLRGCLHQHLQKPLVYSFRVLFATSKPSLACLQPTDRSTQLQHIVVVRPSFFPFVLARAAHTLRRNRAFSLCGSGSKCHRFSYGNFFDASCRHESCCDICISSVSHLDYVYILSLIHI